MIRREIPQHKNNIELCVSHDPYSDAVENIGSNILFFVEKFEYQAVTRLVVFYLEKFEPYRVITCSQKVSARRIAVEMRTESFINLISDAGHKTFREVVFDVSYRMRHSQNRASPGLTKRFLLFRSHDEKAHDVIVAENIGRNDQSFGFSFGIFQKISLNEGFCLAQNRRNGLCNLGIGYVVTVIFDKNKSGFTVVNVEPFDVDETFLRKNRVKKLKREFQEIFFKFIFKFHIISYTSHSLKRAASSGTVTSIEPFPGILSSSIPSLERILK